MLVSEKGKPGLESEPQAICSPEGSSRGLSIKDLVARRAEHSHPAEIRRPHTIARYEDVVGHVVSQTYSLKRMAKVKNDEALKPPVVKSAAGC